MIVSVVLKYTQEQWETVDEDAYNGVFMGVRAEYSEAQKYALELRRKDSRCVYAIRRVRVT